MRYDKKLLENWCGMPCLGDYLDKQGILRMSSEGVTSLIKDYFNEIERRISIGEKMLTDHKNDVLLNFTLAILYDLTNMDVSIESLYKIKTRAYCLRTIRIEPNHAGAWHLLSEAYRWLALVGEVNLAREMEIDAATGNVKVRTNSDQPDKYVIKFLENSIHCLNKCLRIDPLNQHYKSKLQYLRRWRSSEYRAYLENENIDE